MEKELFFILWSWRPVVRMQLGAKTTCCSAKPKTRERMTDSFP